MIAKFANYVTSLFYDGMKSVAMTSLLLENRLKVNLKTDILLALLHN